MARPVSQQASTPKQERHRRVRRKVKGSPERPRLCVYRSLKHIYAQVIDDRRGHTLAAASTLDKEIRSAHQHTGNQQAARAVGLLVAQRARSQGVTQIAFDRGGYLYHGRVRALAEGAREGGLDF